MRKAGVAEGTAGGAAGGESGQTDGRTGDGVLVTTRSEGAAGERGVVALGGGEAGGENRDVASGEDGVTSTAVRCSAWAITGWES